MDRASMTVLLKTVWLMMAFWIVAWLVGMKFWPTTANEQPLALLPNLQWPLPLTISRVWGSIGWLGVLILLYRVSSRGLPEDDYNDLSTDALCFGFFLGLSLVGAVTAALTHLTGEWICWAAALALTVMMTRSFGFKDWQICGPIGLLMAVSFGPPLGFIHGLAIGLLCLLAYWLIPIVAEPRPQPVQT